ncbi:antitoxin VbhA family protein [Sphaerisporangium viridialbum]|uniref:antitoxin VbhA family protein n=1 Tax=Sphaerisporangium viridialbum TaxID=46189 RepID=UPI003C755E74
MPERDEELTERAMAEAIATQRLEGVEPSEIALALMRQVAAGELTGDQAVGKLLERHRA